MPESRLGSARAKPAKATSGSAASFTKAASGAGASVAQAASGSAISVAKANNSVQAAAAAAAFGITRDYRQRWGNEAFRALSSVAFREADVDTSGTLEASELRATLAKVQITLTADECAEVLKQYDDDHNGRLDESEWHALLSDLLDGNLDPTGKSRHGSASVPPARAPLPNSLPAPATGAVATPAAPPKLSTPAAPPPKPLTPAAPLACNGTAELLSQLASLSAKAQATLSDQQTAGQLKELAKALRELSDVADAMGGSKATYGEHMEQWASDGCVALPKPVLLQANLAALQSIGPRVMNRRRQQQQVTDLEAALKACGGGADVGGGRAKSMAVHQLTEAKKRLQQAEAALEDAVDHVEAMQLASSEEISPDLAQDGERYDTAIRRMAEEEAGKLDELSGHAAKLVNTGDLEPNDVVEVVDSGRLRLAQVRSIVDEASSMYEVSLYKRGTGSDDQPYEEGFNTSSPDVVLRGRERIYRSRKHRQKLSEWARGLAGRRAATADARKPAAGGKPAATPAAALAAALAPKPAAKPAATVAHVPPPTSTAFLALLYADAERTLPALHAMGERVRAALPAVVPIVAPLKGEARAAYTTRDKYSGDYSRLTDLARMAFECQTLGDADAVLRALSAHSDAEILLIKNRLMLEFDASATGGYRDMLLNLRFRTTGHIAEVQITLAPLLEIKKTGGHAAYQLARTHNLFERETYRHEGALSTKLLERVRCGVMEELVCRGETAGLAPLFEPLLAVMRSPACSMRVLSLRGCDWPAHAKLDALVDALPARGLKRLVLSEMTLGDADDLGPPLPAGFFEKCVTISTVELTGLSLTGSVPAGLGKWSQLRELKLSQNALKGHLPEELGQCVLLEVLELDGNELTGRVPASLGRCRKLRSLKACGDQFASGRWGNQLDGALPDELGRCAALELLDLAYNALTGRVPASLGQCRKLQTIDLRGNTLEGELPDELGQCAALEVLQLCDNQLTGCMPPSLCQCRKLRILDLARNTLDGDIPDDLGQCLNKLESLDLSGNTLTGRVPASLGQCRKLQMIDLHGNKQLEGPVPPELGRCGALEKLNLANNSLEGGVPASLGQCVKLRLLDLSNNQLEGVAPASELALLSVLQTLRLHGNRGLTIPRNGKDEVEKALPTSCDFIWPKVTGRNHESEEHGGVGDAATCAVCGEEFPSRNKLKKHMKTNCY